MVKRFLPLAFLMVSLAHAGSASSSMEAASEFILRNTEVGASLVRRLTGFEGAEISNSAYRSFRQRLLWERSQLLKAELTERFAKIESDFVKFRQTQGRPVEVSAVEELTAADRAFLSEASAAFKNNRLEDALQEAIVFVNAPVGPHTRGTLPKDLSASKEAFLAPDGKLVEAWIPTRPDPNSGVFGVDGQIELRQLRMYWWERFILRFKAMGQMFNVYRLSQGQWKSIFLRSGKTFSPEDAVALRRLNRVLDVLNDYARMRLTVKAFANEPSVAYSRLNELTAEQTEKFREGLMTIDAYVSARKTAAGELPLNDIVWESERRMLTSLDRCHSLGGHWVGDRLSGGAIQIAEKNIIDAQAELKRISDEIMRLKGNSANKRQVNSLSAQHTLWRDRLDHAVADLRQKYYEFVQNRGMVDIFLNLRSGWIESERVQPMDLPDVFSVSPKEAAAWGELYDRALYNSTNELVLQESKEFFQAQGGKTRAFVRKMNDLTSQVLGKKFTDTPAGKEFKEYARHIVVEGLLRTGSFMGVVVAPAVAAELSQHWVESLWKMFTSKVKTQIEDLEPKKKTKPSVRKKPVPNSEPSPHESNDESNGESNDEDTEDEQGADPTDDSASPKHGSIIKGFGRGKGGIGPLPTGGPDYPEEDGEPSTEPSNSMQDYLNITNSIPDFSSPN